MSTKKQTNVPPIPEGHRSLAPYLRVRNASRAMDFYARAFGAQELFHMPGPDGRIAHAEMQIGDCVLMLADEDASRGCGAPETVGGTPVAVFLYAEDVDGIFANAAAAGATVQMPPTDMFWGDRYGKLKDPFGHEWGVATHIEDVSPEEIQRRMLATASA